MHGLTSGNFFVFLVTSVCLALAGCATDPVAPGSSQAASGIPRTNKPFLNDPQEFQFVVVGDRTGGHRPGVFDRAMDQVNLLRPEFVLSVGDLIEGYSEDPVRLNAEWDEIEQMVGKLQMPLYYTVGNHDMGNEVMYDLWRQRLGADYYHFTYQNVLFISLNTEDPPVELAPDVLARQAALEKMMEENPTATQQRILQRSKNRPKPVALPGSIAIGDKQVDYVQAALLANPDVRWTFILMHKPAWAYPSAQFERIESMLQDRAYTMIAGHEHYYSYSNRKGRDYIDMGTTGGVWLRDGPGKLDHVMWVSMTQDGPVFANIKLDGLFDKRGLE